MAWWIASGGACLILAAAGWIRYTFATITVEGGSMLPTLRAGDRVLVRRGLRGLRRHRIVVVARPAPGRGWSPEPPGRALDATAWIIKRVVALPGDPYPEQVDRPGHVPPDHVVVIGDNPHSDDSKQHGPCPTSQVLGVVVRRFERAATDTSPAGTEPT